MEQSRIRFFSRLQQFLTQQIRFKSDLAHYSSQLSQLALRHSACAYDSLCQEVPRRQLGGLLVSRLRFHRRRGRCFPLLPSVVRRPSALARNPSRDRRRVVIFDLELSSPMVRKVRAMLLTLILMDQTSTTRITLVVRTLTQQVRPAPVGAAALPS